MPVGLVGGPLEEIEDIDELIESYDDHATILAQSTDAQSVLDRLFDELFVSRNWIARTVFMKYLYVIPICLLLSLHFF